MSDTPPTDDTIGNPPPPPPPGAEPIDDRPFYEGLRRSRSDRVLAGVAGGLGRHFGVDPVIVRVGFVLITIFGGSGILLYLLAWLVIAKEGNGETSAMRALRGSPEGNRALLFVVLAVGAILILTSPLVWFDGFGIGDGLALPLLLIAAGVAFLIWPGDTDRRTRRRTDPERDPDTHIDDGFDDPSTYAEPVIDPDTGEAMSTGAEIKMELRSARDEVRSELNEARDSFRQQRREWRHGYRTHRDDRRQRAPRPPREPKPAPFIGPLTVAVLLVFAGLSMVAEQADWWDLDPAIYGGITLGIIGAGLIVSAFFGRGRGLIFLGLAVLPFAWAISAIDLDWHDGVGEQTDVVRSLDDLDTSYTFGIGEYEVDLSNVVLDGAEREVEIGLTIGEVTVWIPDTVNAVIDADARIGEIEVFGADPETFSYDDGIDADLSTTMTGVGDGELVLDIDVGLGAIEIFKCTTTGDPELPTCS